MRSTQRSLFEQLQTQSEKRAVARRLKHGGVASVGKRKLRRPLATKSWIHLVLKSNVAKGKFSMLAERNAKWIESLVSVKAKKFGVEIKDFINMGNHIHFQIRVTKRESFQNFLRSITSLIARHVTGARKGKKFGRFWEALAFTRVISSYLELTQLAKYFVANRVELRRGYSARTRYLDSANEWIQCLRFGKAHPSIAQGPSRF